LATRYESAFRFMMLVLVKDKQSFLFVPS